MNKALTFLQDELNGVRTGMANANMLNKVMVDYYGNPTPIQSLATISIPEARVLSIKSKKRI